LPGKHTDASPDASWLVLGRYPAIARLLRRHFRRTTAGNSGLILIRGWCRQKFKAFKFQKAAKDFVRLNI
jgi:hypothetical protein